MPSGPTITIQRGQFRNVDSDFFNDSDDDDWVSVTPASTTSTSSTLPQNLVLKPGNMTGGVANPSNHDKKSFTGGTVSSPRASLLAQIQARPALRRTQRRSQSCTCSSTSSTKTSDAASNTPTSPSPPSSVKPATMTPLDDICNAAKLRRTTPHDHSSLNQPISGKVLSPIDLLKHHFPTLKAIYIVDKPKTSRFNARSSPIPGTHSLAGQKQIFSSFANMIKPPIALNTGSAWESYLQVCARCAKPKLTLYCDGTWTWEVGGICEEHRTLLTVTASADGAGSQRQECACVKTCGIRVDPGVEANAKMKSDRSADIKSLQIVLDALQPFNRYDLEKSQVRVFDTNSSCTQEVYVHKAGCKSQDHDSSCFAF